MSEAQYLAEHGPQNPNARTAVLIGNMLVSNAQQFPEYANCCVCGYSPGNKVEPGWGVQHCNSDETSTDIFVVCPTCAQDKTLNPVKSVSIKNSPETFNYVMRQVAKRIPKGCLAAVHAFADNHHAWYVVPTNSGFLTVFGPGEFYDDFGFAETVHSHPVDSDTDAVIGARMALGIILGTCTIQQLVGPIRILDVTGDPYMGPIPLPAKVAQKVQRHGVRKRKAHTEVQA